VVFKMRRRQKMPACMHFGSKVVPLTSNDCVTNTNIQKLLLKAFEVLWDLK